MNIKATLVGGLALTAFCAVHTSAAHGTTTAMVVDASGIVDMDERGADSNVVRDVFVGARATIETFSWDINLTSHDPSYLSEMQVTFSDSAGFGVTFTPGGGDDFFGTRSYAGFQDLRVLGQHFQLGHDGLLRLEFHDGYKDQVFDEPEGIWNFGTLTFGVSPVPEPQAAASMLTGLLLMGILAKRRVTRARSA